MSLYYFLNIILLNKIKIDDQETYILFQYDNYIIACAKLDNTILINSHKNYKGYYILPPQTIYTFDKISLNDLNKNIFHNGQYPTLEIHILSKFILIIKHFQGGILQQVFGIIPIES